jgi:hypothetical protein
VRNGQFETVFIDEFVYFFWSVMRVDDNGRSARCPKMVQQMREHRPISNWDQWLR